MTSCATSARRGRVFVAVISISLLAGCGARGDVARHTDRAPALPTATSTVGVAFAIAVTPRATARPRSERPRPTPTKFAAPAGPYLILSPSSGPPVSRIVGVRGGNLPPATTVTLAWVYGPHPTSLTTTAETDHRGNLTASFQVPAAPPGRYRLSAQVSGIPYAAATYWVRSRATLKATIRPNGRGDGVTIDGSHFVPRVKLLLVAYSLFIKRSPVILGSITCSRRGAFRFSTDTRKLIPGEYAVRAWTMDSLVAQVGSTFLLVVA